MSTDSQGPSKSDGLHTKIIHSSQSTSNTIVDNNTKDNKSLFYSTSSYLKKQCKLHFVFTPNQAPSIPGNSNTNLNSQQVQPPQPSTSSLLPPSGTPHINPYRPHKRRAYQTKRPNFAPKPAPPSEPNPVPEPSVMSIPPILQRHNPVPVSNPYVKKPDHKAITLT